MHFIHLIVRNRWGNVHFAESDIGVGIWES